MGSDVVVDLDDVHLSFGRVTALGGLTLDVHAGQVTVLLGPNGAGKTTAARVVTGALAPDSGAVRVFGLDPAGADGGEVRRRCGVVAANPALYDRLSGRDNLRYAAELFGLGPGADLEGSAARFGIDDALDLRVGGYSTGMKTRLALARAILHDPDLLLLDEPTSGLDPESAHAVLQLIDELAAAGKTVVMCTHLLLEAEGLADRVVLLEDGRAVAAGTPAELGRLCWPNPVVIIDAEDRERLDLAREVPGVVSYERNGGPARLALDDVSRVPDVVSALCAGGARLTRVAPHQPTLEDVYFAVRRGGTGAVGPGAASVVTGMEVRVGDREEAAWL